MNWQDMTIQEINEWVQECRKQIGTRKAYNLYWAAEIVYIELINATREALLKGGTDVSERREELTERLFKAKTTLRDIRGIKSGNTSQSNYTETSNWFDRARQRDLGIAQEGSDDDRSEDFTG